jgi:hypothetical protein
MAKKLFQPGHTGRPKGTRNKLAIQVFEDVLQHWNEPIEEGSERRKGPEALELCFKENPGEYLRFGAAAARPMQFQAQWQCHVAQSSDLRRWGLRCRCA